MNVLWTSGTGFDSVQRPVKACWLLLIMKGPVFRHYGPRIWLRYTSIGRVKLFSCLRSQRATSPRGDKETIGARKNFSRPETHLRKNIFPTSAPQPRKLSPPWGDFRSEKASFVIPVEARRANTPRKLRSSSRAAGVGRGDLLEPREVNGGNDEEKKPEETSPLLNLPGLGIDAELREPDAAGLLGAEDEFSFQQFGDFRFGDARHGGNYLEVAEAGIRFH